MSECNMKTFNPRIFRWSWLTRRLCKFSIEKKFFRYKLGVKQLKLKKSLRDFFIRGQKFTWAWFRTHCRNTCVAFFFLLFPLNCTLHTKLVRFLFCDLFHFVSCFWLIFYVEIVWVVEKRSGNGFFGFENLEFKF